MRSLGLRAVSPVGLFILVLVVYSGSSSSADCVRIDGSIGESCRYRNTPFSTDEADLVSLIDEFDDEVQQASVSLMQGSLGHSTSSERAQFEGSSAPLRSSIRFPRVELLSRRAQLLEELAALEMQEGLYKMHGCDDSEPGCSGWAQTGECDRNPSWMRSHCKKSCGQCPQAPAPTGRPTPQPTPRPTPTPTRAPIPPPSACTDSSPHCHEWAASGECETNSQWMHANCMKSCSSCGGIVTCVDMHATCSSWASSGECRTNAQWMRLHCRKSCLACPKPDGCDTVSDCMNTECDAKRDKCYNAVIWAMDYGMQSNPEWYPGLDEKSHFEDVQSYMHTNQPGQGCPKPCPWAPPTTTTRTTTTTTPPFGTPACPPRPRIPEPPSGPTDYNGISWPELCFVGEQEEHVFLIGDWGGVYGTGDPPRPADNCDAKRNFIDGIDDQAQTLVAEQFIKRAAISRPRYVLNVGDNFYWAGIFEKCGKSVTDTLIDFNNQRSKTYKQVKAVFEDVYKGPGVDGIPWISCLGNHDYGGFSFSHAWDQQIVYTWGPSGRWIMPGQYYHQHVTYPTKGFSIDYYVIDSCNQDSTDPEEDPVHNICSAEHNSETCYPFGPSDPTDCVTWFVNLWKKQLVWLEKMLQLSTADWQIVVTHFPPESWTHYGDNVWDWKKLGMLYGIDLIIAGHRHNQEMFAYNSWSVRHMSTIPYVVTGGGGGVTSEREPSNDSSDSGFHQYGFMDMTVSKTEIKIENFNQLGVMTKNITVWPKRINPDYVDRRDGQNADQPPHRISRVAREEPLVDDNDDFAAGDGMPHA